MLAGDCGDADRQPGLATCRAHRSGRVTQRSGGRGAAELGLNPKVWWSCIPSHAAVREMQISLISAEDGAKGLGFKGFAQALSPMLCCSAVGRVRGRTCGGGAVTGCGAAGEASTLGRMQGWHVVPVLLPEQVKVTHL